MNISFSIEDEYICFIFQCVFAMFRLHLQNFICETNGYLDKNYGIDGAANDGSSAPKLAKNNILQNILEMA